MASLAAPGLTALLVLVLVLLRAPDILPPRLWAEDGVLFISGFLARGLATFTEPYAGYLHLLPRLAAAGLAFVPLDHALVLFTAVVFAVTGWSAAILFRAFGGGLPGVVAATALALAPGWDEALGSVTNLQWVMAPVLLALVLDRGRVGRAEAIAFSILAGLSGPFSALFAPVAVAAAVIDAMDRRLNGPALCALACGLIQLAVLALHAPEPIMVEAARPLWLARRLFDLPLSASLVPFMAALALGATIIGGERRFVRCGFLIAAAMLTASVMAKYHHQPGTFESGLIAQRYWYVPGVLWLFVGASALREPSRRLRWLGLAGVVLALSGLPFGQLQRPWPWLAEDWVAFVEAARNGPATYRYAPNWSMTLDLSP